MAGETVTRHAFLALRDEHGFVAEGLAFLDEKRLLLAQRILEEHALYVHERAALDTSWQAALATLADALGERGLLALAVAEVPRHAPALPGLERRAHLGVPLLQVTPAHGDLDGEGVSAPLQRRCADAFAAVAVATATLAARAGNLHRLVAEYRRTDRRASALENVILPELGARLRVIEAALEDGDLEETLRTRLAIAHAGGLL